VSEKLIVFFDHPHDRFGLEDGIVLHAEGEHFEDLLFACEHDATKFPIQETVPGGCRIMVWEGEQVGGPLREPDSEPVFRGTWRAAIASDLILAEMLESAL
jgi:hypothetical protein